MTETRNVEILKEVDTFLQQAKLEGEISGSSSNLSIEINQRKKSTEINLNRQNKQQQNTVHGNQVLDQTNLTSVRGTNAYSLFTESRLSETKMNVNYEAIEINDIKYKSAYVEIGSEHNRDTSYVGMLQNQRSGITMNNLETTSDLNEQTGLLMKEEEVNSALFWERWMDKIFQAYDHWVNNSSESEDNETTPIRSYSTFELNDKRNIPISNQPNKTRSEPSIGTKTANINEMKCHIRYKCPSYVDWLAKKRQQQKIEGIMSNKNPDENTADTKTKYWTNMYRKVYKSFSGNAKSTKSKDMEERAKPAPENKISSSSSSESHRVSSSIVQRQQTYNHRNKFRCKQFSQESVNLTNTSKLELVNNSRLTSDSESSDDLSSSSQENLRRCKSHRRYIKRKY